MHYILQYVDFLLHINVHLAALVQQYGGWVYAAVGFIVFLECGIIFTPFLPGESMLFAFGTVAAAGEATPHGIVMALASAAIIGGFFNYSVGYWVGKKWLVKIKSETFHKHIRRTDAFYQKHGMIAVLLARLIPIVRTFAPFLAGVVRMNFAIFSLYNILGGIIWISIFIYIGYYFGTISFVQEHFPWIVITIIILSIIPLIIEYLKTMKQNNYEKRI